MGGERNPVGVTLGHLLGDERRADSLVQHRQLGGGGVLPRRHPHHDHRAHAQTGHRQVQQDGRRGSCASNMAFSLINSVQHRFNYMYKIHRRTAVTFFC